MAVKVRVKGDPPREYVFPDDKTVQFTAQGMPDGRLEVTEHRKGSSEPRLIYVFAAEEIDRVLDNGWPSDDGPL